MSYSVRIFRACAGLFICSFGMFCRIRANIGLAPWDAFNIGVSELTGLSYGTVNMLVGLLIILAGIRAGEKYGIGTIINIFEVGLCVDIFSRFDLLPYMENYYAGLALMLAGQVLLAAGTYLHIGAGLGCGAKDSLMVILARRFPSMPIGVARGLVEGGVLCTGWLLGAKVGVGTLISMFGISYFIHAIFRVMNFDVKAVKQESIAYSLTQMTRGFHIPLFR